MSVINLTQAGFNGGEISPTLYARTNIEKYQSSAKVLKNFMVKAHGGLEKRGGSYFIAPVVENIHPSRLIKFQFSENQGYALEFGNKVMRVISHDGLVTSSSGDVFELETKYDIDCVWQMKIEQSADVVFIFHPLHMPTMLKRYGHDDWKMEEMIFKPIVKAPENLSAKASTVGETNYKYKVTAIFEETGEESLPAEVSILSKTLSSENTVTLTWDKVLGCKKYSIYRFASGMYGWISTIVDEDSKSSVEMMDDNVKIDFNVTPPTSRNPFDEPGKYPSTGAIYEQRMGMAATLEDFELIELSKPSNYNNFTMSNPLLDDDAISVRASGRKVNTIFDFIPLKDLLLTTANGIWKMTSSSETNYLSPKSCKVKQQNVYVCENITPLVIGNTALFMADGKVRTLGYSLESDGYDGNDISIFASHLFDDRQLVAWDYVSRTSQVWFAFADGGIVTMTFVPEHQLFAFTRYETQGWFESICTVRDDYEEVIFAVVMREIDGVLKRYIEKFVINKNVRTKTDDFLFLDCASELVSSSPVTKISGLDYIEGCEVGIWADGAYQPLRKVVNGKVELNIPSKNVKIGLLYDVVLHTLNVDYPTSQISGSAQGKNKRIVAVDLNVSNSGYFEVGVVSDNMKYSSPNLTYKKYGEGAELVDGYTRVDLFGGYTKNGEMILKTNHPSPLVINAIIPEVSHGG